MRLNASSAKFRLDPVVSVHLLHPLIRVFSSKSSPHPLSPCSPTHPPEPWGGAGGLLHGWSLAFFVIVMRPSRGQRCQRQQYDSQRRSAHWAPPSPPPPSLSLHSVTPSASRVHLNAPRLSMLSTTPPSCRLIKPPSPQRNSASFGTFCRGEDRDGSWLRGVENRLRLRAVQCVLNPKVTVEMVMFFVRGQKVSFSWK